MIETERLILRGWRPSDVPEHNRMCTDPVFMRTLGPPISMAESQGAMDRQNRHLAEYGSCFYAVERKADGRFIGYCGIKPGPDDTPIAAQPEIGWGIAPDCWRRGYAREAAAASLEWAWANTDWQLVAAITTPANVPSWKLMERLGMARDPAEDFDHPKLAEGDPLRAHITYRIARP